MFDFFSTLLLSKQKHSSVFVLLIEGNKDRPKQNHHRYKFCFCHYLQIFSIINVFGSKTLQYLKLALNFFLPLSFPFQGSKGLLKFLDFYKNLFLSTSDNFEKIHLDQSVSLTWFSFKMKMNSEHRFGYKKDINGSNLTCKVPTSSSRGWRDGRTSWKEGGVPV